MERLALVATGFVALVCILIGLRLGRRSERLADHLPLEHGRLARVHSAGELSASTVASTLSLATVIIAFFELAPFFGAWLMWPVVTTALGLLVVRLAAKRITELMAGTARTTKPTLHEFLAEAYAAPNIAVIGASCTSVGYFGAFAVELYVGASFLASFLPHAPLWIVVVVLAMAGTAYTAAGGFRAVIVTDRLQMGAVWLLLCAMTIAVAEFSGQRVGGLATLWAHGAATSGLHWRPELWSFLVGIFLINVPAYVSDMGIWQRIAGTDARDVVLRGMGRSVGSAMVTWGAFAVFACLAPAIAPAPQGTTPLVPFLRAAYELPHGGLLFFVAVLGLYGAMLSTSSTHLIAVTHTLQQDILPRVSSRTLDAPSALRLSRLVTLLSASVSVLLVAALSKAGFSVADLVFAVYGAQLSLAPLMLTVLIFGIERARRLGSGAALAVACGFAAGWTTAIAGRLSGSSIAVFLAPAASLLVSSVVLAWAAVTRRATPSSSAISDKWG